MSWCIPKSAHKVLFALALVTTSLSTLTTAQRVVQTNLVSDVAAWAPTVDPNLVNASHGLFGTLVEK